MDNQNGIIVDLMCGHNKFQTFDGFPHEMIGLHHLDLSYNQLISFKGFPQSLPDLEGLYLVFNRLSTLLPTLSSIAPKLERLTLSNNQIQSLKDLSSLSKLNFLYLDNNKLASLEGLPPILPLKTLHVSGNHLENFAGFPSFPADDHANIDIDIDLQFYDNPLSSLHGIPRHFLQSAVKSFLFTNENYWNGQMEITSKDHKERIRSFRFSPRGMELINLCLSMFSEYQFEISQDCFNAFNALHVYYTHSPTDLALFYIQDQDLLTDEERGRLIHEATKAIRDMLELSLPSSDPVLEAIATRINVPSDSGFSLLV